MTSRSARFGIALALVIATACPARGVEPDEVLRDPSLEGRARAISANLRCLVCQNQSIDDSDAPLARDLRLLVRDRLQAGDTDAQIRDYVVGRYGEFVLLQPRFGPHTAALWLAPFLVLGGAVGWLWLVRRRRLGTVPAGLTDEERARILQLERDAELGGVGRERG
ncbi:MAG: cytochrome [Enterovirga sp.]|jgi:cytochrome c-type biogenesis protein CcmH|nr:cytochrome [Enterovirga sp.]